MAQAYALRLPHALAGARSDFNAPSFEWLAGQWWVTHTSLPLWKDKRNVTITYKTLPADKHGVVRIEDTSGYQASNSDKVKTIVGADTPVDGDPGAFDWRGYGWLKVASSHWEILGWGEVEAGGQWVATYFQKTLFTPAGVDVYSRSKEGLPAAAMDEITKSLHDLDHPELKRLVESIYETTRN
ncbi:MAG: hypothetical protein MMC23_005369 [Stictis urceolatum]|nr:hypothetical protein [Stictis urceolata]